MSLMQFPLCKICSCRNLGKLYGDRLASKCVYRMGTRSIEENSLLLLFSFPCRTFWNRLNSHWYILQMLNRCPLMLRCCTYCVAAAFLGQHKIDVFLHRHRPPHFHPEIETAHVSARKIIEFVFLLHCTLLFAPAHVIFDVTYGASAATKRKSIHSNSNNRHSKMNNRH